MKRQKLHPSRHVGPGVFFSVLQLNRATRFFFATAWVWCSRIVIEEKARKKVLVTYGVTETNVATVRPSITSLQKILCDLSCENGAVQLDFFG